MKNKRLLLIMLMLIASVSLFAATSFPSFVGTDLSGNPVDDSIFKGKVTVVNFWFSTCPPCIAELSELDKLNKELQAKGGMVIGINVDTLDDNEKMIEKAKSILKTKGATYRNITFPSSTEAGKFVRTIMAYPTTYVVDKNGNIVGSPIVGGITSRSLKRRLLETIDKAYAM